MSETLVLSHSDVKSLNIPAAEIIEAVKQGLMDHALKNTLLAPKITFRPEPESFYTSMPSGNRKDGVLGLKLIQRPSFNDKNGPSVFGTMFLNDYSTGELLSIMDATWLTSIRTGAVAALSISSYAVHPVEKISIMGIGNVGLATLLCIAQTMPSVKQIKVLDYKDSITRISDRFGTSRFNIIRCSSIEDLFSDTQVVITALTYAEKPFVKKEWLFDGIFALPLHMRGWQDVDPLFDRMFTDDYAHTKSWLYRFDGELGEVLAGMKKGREHSSQKIIAYNYGIAIDDLAVSKLIYEYAVKKGAGTRMTLGDYEGKYLI